MDEEKDVPETLKCGQITEQLGRLVGGADGLEKEIKKLRNCLEVILNPEETIKETEEKPPLPVPLAEGIRILVVKVAGFTEQIKDIERRVEL